MKPGDRIPPKTRQVAYRSAAERRAAAAHPYSLMKTRRGWGSFSAAVVLTLVLASTGISIYDLFLLGRLLKR
jgi:hypothetical protein